MLEKALSFLGLKVIFENVQMSVWVISVCERSLLHMLWYIIRGSYNDMYKPNNLPNNK